MLVVLQMHKEQRHMGESFGSNAVPIVISATSHSGNLLRAFQPLTTGRFHLPERVGGRPLNDAKKYRGGETSADDTGEKGKMIKRQVVMQMNAICMMTAGHMLARNTSQEVYYRTNGPH